MQRLLLLLISTVLLSAQAPPDSTAYSVAYVDIVPASRTAAITAIKQYRDASRKDDGFQRIEFFEQAGRPAHFCIIETWANNKDLDTHAASANAKDFRTKIDSMRLSDYDQRPYKTLSLGAARNDGSNRSTFVITHVDIGGQGANAADLLRKLAEASRKKKAISGSMSYSTRCGRIISRLSKNGRPQKQSRRMRLQLTRRNTGTALG